MSKWILAVAVVGAIACAACITSAQPVIPFVVRDLFVADGGGTNNGSAPQSFVTVGPRVYFTARTELGQELWVTDGTPAGTTLVRDIRIGFLSGEPTKLTPGQTLLYFEADDGFSGRVLWRTDGTSGGTRMVVDEQTGLPISQPIDMSCVGDRLYFRTSFLPFLTHYYYTDGLTSVENRPVPACCLRDGTCVLISTSECVQLRGILKAASLTCDGISCLADVPLLCCLPDGFVTRLDPNDCIANGGTPETGAPCGITTSWIGPCCLPDGTCVLVTNQQCHAASGARKRLETTSCSPSPCIGAPSVVCCVGISGCFRFYTEADCAARFGTIVPNATACTGQCPPDFPVSCCYLDGSCALTSFNLCFQARGFAQTSDVTCAAAPCLDAVATSGPYTLNTFSPMIDIGGQACFFATASQGARMLLSTNGPASSYAPIIELSGIGPLWYRSLGPLTVFAFEDPQHGLELWVTDGTAAGTQMLRDIKPGVDSGLTSGAQQSAVSGGLLYFVARQSADLDELWSTDGTPHGTRRVSDFIQHGIASPRDFSPADNGLVFTATYFAPGGVRSWWYTDGTTQGTIRLGDGDIPFGNLPRPGIGFGSGVITHTAAGLVHLTPASSTTLIPRPPNSNDNPFAFRFQTVSNKVLFVADTALLGLALSDELWSTDGTPAGTGLFKDINTSGSQSSFGAMAAGPGGLLYFAAGSSATGQELYKTSGTLASTSLVKDLNPGPPSSFPRLMASTTSTLVFAADVPNRPRALCKSDGTPNGTTTLGDPTPGASGGSTANGFAILNDRVYYWDTTPANGATLFVSDGTPAGSGLFFDPVPGPAGTASGLVFNSSSLVYFSNGSTLYRTDGSLEGTFPLSTTLTTPLADTPLGTFFAGPTNSNANLTRQLYLSSGTDATTFPVATGTTFPNSVSNAAWINGKLFFRGRTSLSGSEPWVSDGTAAGTVRLRDIIPGGGSSNPSRPVAFGGQAYFVAGLGLLYRSDGTPGGTVEVFEEGDIANLVLSDSVFPIGSTLLFVAQSVDTPGQYVLRAYTGDPMNVVSLTAGDPTWPIQNVLVAGQYAYFFRSGPGSSQFSLHRTDGTPAGTVTLDVTPSFSSVSLPPWAAVGNDIYLCATDPLVGQELFRTQAPGLGATLAGDAWPGPSSSIPSTLRVLPSGGVFFTAFTDDVRRQVFFSSGSQGSLREVYSVNTATAPRSANAIVGTSSLAYFFDPTSAMLGCTDGTDAGTRELTNFESPSGQFSPGVEFNGVFYFGAKKGAFDPLAELGTELFRSDGSVQGTYLFKDVLVGVPSSSPRNFAVAGSKLFFTPSSSGTPLVPWVSNGTASGTLPLSHTPPTDGSPPVSGPLIPLGDSVLFPASGPFGRELYRSDHVAGTTSLVADIRNGDASSSPTDLTNGGPVIYFVADDGIHGRELWLSDGATAGTRLVRDICPGPLSSTPTSLTFVGGRLYFTAYTPENGIEIWTSDGTPIGTFMLFESSEGSASAQIQNLTPAGDRLYFLASGVFGGTSLWSFDWVGGVLFLCPADYDRDGDRAISDVFAFISDWFEQASRADMDGDGTIEPTDIFDFLNLWFTGCS